MMELKNQTGSFTTSRPLAKFPPSVWGDRFLSYTPKSGQAQEDQLVEELKVEVKRRIKKASSDYMKQLQMVDAIQRLGLSYLFEEEIDQALHNLFQLYEDHCNDHHDLYTVALSFRLLRQHGFRISCQVFDKFKDTNSEFKVPNIQEEVMGMLEFFEATHLRIRGEDVLDHGYTFSRKYLESLLPSLDSPVFEQVDYALNQYSYWRGLTRLKARNYISIYGQYAFHDQCLLRLARLDFNRLQSEQQGELSEIYRWWKGLDFATKLPFARNRLVECYFWILAVYFEPEYAFARKITVRVLAMLSIMDDIYDAYGTLNELQIFAEAIKRWDMSCLDQLPDYMKSAYKGLLQLLEEVEKDLTKQGRSFRVSHGIKAIQDLSNDYFTEAKWREEKYTPPTEEYMRVATGSCGYTALFVSSFLGMGDEANREAFEWVLSKPSIVRAATRLCRLTADIVAHEFERQRDHVVSSVECYTKEHNVRKEETIAELRKRLEAAWKDINEELIRPTEVPVSLLHRILNFCRVIEGMYSKGDWYTHVGPEMRSFITQVLIDPLPLN